jgi:hypothetical protein
MAHGQTLTLMEWTSNLGGEAHSQVGSLVALQEGTPAADRGFDADDAHLRRIHLCRLAPPDTRKHASEFRSIPGH